MEGVSLALSAAQTVFAALQNKEVRDTFSMFGYESQLEKLEATVKTVNTVLLDVDSKSQGLSNEGKLWVERLNDAVYDVDDVLDEVITVRQQRNHMPEPNFMEKVSQFFSLDNEYLVAFNVSQEIIRLREQLDAIADNHTKFGIRLDVEPVKRREETCSVAKLEVIGRETEKEEIVGKLLSDGDSSDRKFSIVNIVGMGGLGKTTVAQLVYNDERVKQRFLERVWVCVSEEFGVKEILGKMLPNKDSTSTLEHMGEEVRKLLANKRYLLVLDDVWSEKLEEWHDLEPFLVSDVSGSKIIVTSRSKKVATSIGRHSTMYELKGLSEENSWRLFESIAFEGREDQLADSNFVDIGKGIVKKCVNVPLSIRVIASLLRGLDKSQWEKFAKSNDLAKMSQDGSHENSIMPTLRFSYYQLTPELKSCFSLCSLFPKDHIIIKEELIGLWLAQGFLVSTLDAQSMEDVGERYITILLNRCFFQDVRKDEDGHVSSFKMHDLMHDLAIDVAGNESLNVTPETKNHLGKKIRHLSTSRWAISNMCLSDTLRTYICLGFACLDVTTLISKCRNLRALRWRNVKFVRTTLPGNLGKLLHLRYLDLSRNYELEMLPKSITKLHNLQILKLSECTKLKGLPEDMGKLVNLRTLDISGCEELTYMPRGMSNLTNLHRLTEFLVGGVDPKQTQGSKLVDLQHLRSLKGDLCIRILKFCPHNKPHATERALILKNAHVESLRIVCYSNEDDIDQSEVHETLIEDLCPNDDIRRIEIVGYEGTKLPSWASRMESDMNGVQEVTSLSQFCLLKVLKLWDLRNVEYIESDVNESRPFFPVLEELELRKMPKLKGWWREVRWREMEGGGKCLVDANGLSIESYQSMTYFPCLQNLSIERCHNMIYFPPCPHVKRLKLMGVNEAFTFCRMGNLVVSSASLSSSSSTSVSILYLEKLEIDNARVMNSILRDDFVGGVLDIQLSFDHEMKSMGTVKEGFEKACQGLRSLSIKFCKELNLEDEEEEGVPWKYLQSLSSLELGGLPKMVNLPKGLGYLTSLQSLSISWCDNLEELGEFIGFLTSLQSLSISWCENLEELGECIGFLTSLQSLEFIECFKLKSLPESMCHLTSLTSLKLDGISDQLRERCRHPDGEDWPKICHIPEFRLLD